MHAFAVAIGKTYGNVVCLNNKNKRCIIPALPVKQYLDRTPAIETLYTAVQLVMRDVYG